MKIILALTILLGTLNLQAAFIKSESLYGLKKRFDKHVNNDGDVYITLKNESHGKWINHSKMIKSIKKDFQGYGLMGFEVKKLSKGKKAYKELYDFLDVQSEPYFCYPLQLNPGIMILVTECRWQLERLIYDVPEKADQIHIINIWGDYYDDYHEKVVIFSNFKTKETATLHLPVYHDI